MEAKFSKIKSWISSNFQVITLGLLVFTVVIVLKQQNDIQTLKGQINELYYKVDQADDNVNSKLDDVDSKLNNVENNLIEEINDVKRTVRIWIN